ncbi:6-pyruvoyl tetrahydrobiopterin synthase-like [Haliotis rufescens]|uniref:6-pyruvoyl tetrahydrobiopterin synthase-like n=1 Tax=Haliotis rufescens TaxID=6454 RepID=UPI001EB043C3|nr:6-pyruvoyl tetrahydrobiopterin synthase-like [Haliotis rufescens]
MERSENRIVYVSRTETFSAGHRLFTEKLTDVENEKIFGKCTAVNGHGHNYKVRVTLRGPVHPVTGMVFNLTTLRRLMTECIMDVLDHKNINVDVPHFRDTVASSENVALYIWKQMSDRLPANLLNAVEVKEIDEASAVYFGEKSGFGHVCLPVCEIAS